MEFIDILVTGGGFVLGGAAMWVVFKFNENTSEHKQLMEALDEHAKQDGAKLDKLCDKMDVLIEIMRGK